jgi:hypothetical protein
VSERTHDADCHVWSRARICTCGYFHRTMAEPPYKAPDSEREREWEHEARIYFLEENHPEPMYVPPTPEEAAKREAMLKELFDRWGKPEARAGGAGEAI